MDEEWKTRRPFERLIRAFTGGTNAPLRRSADDIEHDDDRTIKNVPQ